MKGHWVFYYNKNGSLKPGVHSAVSKSTEMKNAMTFNVVHIVTENYAHVTEDTKYVDQYISGPLLDDEAHYSGIGKGIAPSITADSSTILE